MASVRVSNGVVRFAEFMAILAPAENPVKSPDWAWAEHTAAVAAKQINSFFMISPINWILKYTFINNK